MKTSEQIVSEMIEQQSKWIKEYQDKVLALLNENFLLKQEIVVLKAQAHFDKMPSLT